MKSTLVSVADKNEGVVFLEINVDENPILPLTYDIRAIPTYIVFKDGEVVDQIIGMTSSAKIQKLINMIIQAG